MAKRNQIPEEFIRDLIKRGFNRDNILSRASKKDQGFFRLVSEILNHSTLIDKIERQVDGIQQSQINFDNNSYSSKTILEDIEKRIASNKESVMPSKTKDKGRSNLPIHTDVHMNDLEAPLPDNFKIKKMAYSISGNKNGNKLPQNNISLFEEDQHQSDLNTELTTSEKKLILFPLVQKESTSDETSKLPEAKVNAILEQIKINHKISSVSQIEMPTTYVELEKDKLINIIKQKELLLDELDRNLGTKEASNHVDRKIAKEIKTKQAHEIIGLRQTSSIYRIALYFAVGIFTCVISFLLLSENTSEKINVGTLAKRPILELPPVTDNEGVSEVNPLNIVNNNNDEKNINTNESLPVVAPLPTAPEIKYVIKKGDTFWKITSKYLGKENAHMYKKVMKFNGITKENIVVGKTIKIPTLAELEE